MTMIFANLELVSREPPTKHVTVMGLRDPIVAQVSKCSLKNSLGLIC